MGRRDSFLLEDTLREANYLIEANCLLEANCLVEAKPLLEAKSVGLRVSGLLFGAQGALLRQGSS